MANETMTLQSRSFPIDLARRLDTIAASLGVTRARLLPAVITYALETVDTHFVPQGVEDYREVIEWYERGGLPAK